MGVESQLGTTVKWDRQDLKVLEECGSPGTRPEGDRIRASEKGREEEAIDPHSWISAEYLFEHGVSRYVIAD